MLMMTPPLLRYFWFHSIYSLAASCSLQSAVCSLQTLYIVNVIGSCCFFKFRFPGAPLTYFNDGGVRQRFIFYTPKNPNFRICLPKKIPTFFCIPKKIPQCFCISKFYYLSSGKLKHANLNFGFGQKQNYKLRLCYF